MVEQLGRARAPAYQLRVEDVVDGRGVVDGVCYLCHHEQRVDLEGLLQRPPQRFHWITRHTRILELERYLRCTRCNPVPQPRREGACKLRVTWPDA